MNEEISLEDIAKGLVLAIDSEKIRSLPRSYLGMSQLGHSCSRYLWYYFKWAAILEHDARKERIFRRGDLEEARVLSYLFSLGIEVLETQSTVKDCGGHVSGHTDGLITNIPDLEKEIVLLEIKTMKASAWRDVNKNKVKISKKEYWIQTQKYMLHTKTKLCLFVSVNKDTEELYFEFIEFDAKAAQLYSERAADIVWSILPPKKINEDPKWFECNWCAFKPQCHEQAPFVKTCRMCSYSKPSINGTWFCKLHDKTLSLEEQKAACLQYDVLKI